MQLPQRPVPPGVVRTALAFRRRLQGLADAGIPPEGALVDLSWGLHRTKLAGALVSSGLADAMGTAWREPRDLAAELGLDPAVTTRVLYAAVVTRLASLDRRGRVKLTAMGAPLRRNHPRSLASWILYQASPTRARACGDLDGQLREGAEPSGHRRAYGASMWDHFAEHPDEAATFGEAMRELTSLDAAALARAYPWPRRGVVCDVGGGIGTLLAAILDHRRDLRGILVESSDVLKNAAPYLQSRGVADRVDLVAGDFFGELDVTADVYVLKWIMHDWSDGACREILTRVRKTMPTGAKVVTIDGSFEPGRPDPVTSMSDLHMLVVTEGGRERSPGEVHALMREAGIEPGQVRHAGLQMLVEGVARS